MPIYDRECQLCHHMAESIESVNEAYITRCPRCGKGGMLRIISSSGQYTANQDAPWIKSVLEVVDRKSPAPHVQEFLKHPTRSNYKQWMKKEGIRPADHSDAGAPPVYRRPPDPDLSRIQKEVWEKHRERKRIEI